MCSGKNDGQVNKQEIRTEIRRKRKELSSEEWQKKSHAICQRILSLPEYRQAQVIYAYLAKQGEVCLDELICQAIADGKQVVVPKVLGEEMEFYRLRDLNEVEIGCMGIREPLSREMISYGAEEISLEAVAGDSHGDAAQALMLLPAVAVDEAYHRVGYGGGYYDKYLEKHPELLKIAAVFEFQVYPQVPVEEYDISLEGIVTEMRAWKRSQKPMVYLCSPSTDAEFNLALEQYVFEEMDRSQEYFMLWQNASAIIIGKNQNTIEEINQKYVEDHNIQVVRRLSGGGAVYHDLGNLNFTFIMDAGDTSQMDLHAFCRPIAKALRQMGVEAEVNGRNDITIEGRKFSGNSQYVRKGRVMHHGTLMFDSDLSVVSECLKVSRDKVESKGIKSVRSRVTNIREHLKEDVSLEQFRELLIHAMEGEGTGDEEDITAWGCPMERYTFTPEELARVEEIRQERYGRWQWNYGYSPKHSICKERRVEGCGQIVVSMEVKEGYLEQICFRGDYFGNEDASCLAELLEGCALERETLTAVLAQAEVEKYFHCLTAEQLVDILLQ